MQIKKIIKRKSNNKILTYNEIEYMVNGYVNGDINDENMTLFIRAIYEKGMTRDETYYLTDVMIKSGLTLDMSSIQKVTCDKHSTGGVGDKTSIILLPICASLNIAIPKMSGRGLGITGGTVDKLESIPGFKSNLSIKKFRDIVNSVGCADICQSKEIAVADKKIYKLRDETGYVDSIPLIASSIMSKKIACGSKNIVIDLKVGNGAFVKDIRHAKKLAKLMIYIGKKYNRKVVCILTDMNMPLGTNIGNILEIREVVNFFNGKRDKRLENLIISIASYMVSISKKVSLKCAKNQVLLVIDNGVANSKFYEWIKAQGGNIDEMKMNAKRIDVRSVGKGFVNGINAEKLGRLSISLGAGRINSSSKLNPNVGLILKKKIGDYVDNDEVLGSIYYNNEVGGMIKEFLSSFMIEDKAKKSKDIILKVVK